MSFNSCLVFFSISKAAVVVGIMEDISLFEDLKIPNIDASSFTSSTWSDQVD